MFVVTKFQQDTRRTCAEAAVRRCSSKQMFLKLSTGKHMYENLSFNKVAGLRAATLFIKNSHTGIFL